MKVSELIQDLQKLDPNLIVCVKTAICDSYGMFEEEALDEATGVVEDVGRICKQDGVYETLPHIIISWSVE